MNAVTLDTLRAEFIDSVLETLDAKSWGQWPSVDTMADRWATAADSEAAEALFRMGLEGVMAAASIYTIARDHGLKAAMLFKLSGGNIDPRP